VLKLFSTPYPFLSFSLFFSLSCLFFQCYRSNPWPVDARHSPYQWAKFSWRILSLIFINYVQHYSLNHLSDCFFKIFIRYFWHPGSLHFGILFGLIEIIVVLKYGEWFFLKLSYSECCAMKIWISFKLFILTDFLWLPSGKVII
jgi:hypothetical protein